MSHPKVTPKSITVPEKAPEKTADMSGAVNPSSDAFKAGSVNKFAKYQMALPTNDPTLDYLADNASRTAGVQQAVEEDPYVISQPLDFFQQLRMSFNQGSRAKLKDFTRFLPTIPPLSRLMPYVNSIKDKEERKSVLLDIILNYKRKLNTLMTMEKAMKKSIQKGNTDAFEAHIQLQYKEILKKTKNFCIQQYNQAVSLYNKLMASGD